MLFENKYIKLIIELLVIKLILINKKIIKNKILIQSRDELLKLKKITKYVKTIHSDSFNLNLGNGLFVINNLINICANIKCKYILIPNGLGTIFK